MEGIRVGWLKRVPLLLGAFFLFFMLRSWPDTLSDWVKWRGTPGREVLFGELMNDEEAHRWHGLPPFMSVHDARQIRDDYSLH